MSTNTDPINIEFVINSPELMAEYQKLVAGGKSVDESVDALRNKYQQLTAAQVLNAKGAQDVVQAVNSISVAQERLIAQIDKAASSKTLVLDPDELKVIAERLDSTNDGFEAMNGIVDIISAKMKFLDQSTQDFKDLEAAIDGYNQVLGRSSESASKVVNNTEKISGKNLTKLRDTTIGISKGFQLASAASDTFGAKNQLLESAVQRSYAAIEFLDVVIQMTNQNIDASGTSISTVTKIKNLWTAASLRVAAALGITTVAAQALMTLGLSAVIAGIVYVFANWSTELEKTAEKQRALAEEASKGAAEMLAKYKALQTQYQSFNGDIEKQQKFVLDNADSFKELGYKIENVNDAEKFFVSQSNNVVKSLLARAEAAAALQLATKEYEKALKMDADIAKENATYKEGSSFVKFNRFLRNTIGYGSTEERKKQAETDALTYVTTYSKNLEKAQKDQQKTTLKGVDKKAGTFKLDADLQKEANAIEVMKARGINTDKLESALYNKKIVRYKNDADVHEKIVQEKAIFEAGILKKQDDKAKELSDKRQLEAESAARKAENEDRQLAEKRINFLQEVNQAEDDLQNSRNSSTDEIASIENKFSRMTAKAQKLGMAQNVLDRITKVKDETKSDASYKKKTSELLKRLELEKEAYSAYEAIKTKIGEDEAAKRLKINEKEFKSFGDLLNAEIKKLTENQTRTFVENERLAALNTIKTKYDADKTGENNAKFAAAYQDTLTHKEKLDQLDRTYAAKEIQLQKITNETLRNEKLAELQKQKQIEIDAAKDVAFQKTDIYRRLSENLIGISKRELDLKIKFLQDYLANAENIDPTVRAKLEKSLEEAKDVKGKSNTQVQINALKQQELTIQEALKDKTKLTANEVINLENEAAALTIQMEKLKKASPFSETAEWASMISSTFSELSASIGDSNEGLSDTIATIGQLAGAVADVAGGIVESIMSGNPIAAIGGIIKGISKIFSIGKAARESEKKAAEEMKKRQDEIFQSGIDYNAMLRQRLATELKLNDAVQSRVNAIREEMGANKKNFESIERDYQNVFNRLLKSKTTTGQRTEKYGGFLGIGRKTKAVNIEQDVASLLGIAQGSKVTDEILDRLDAINAKQPLTGDAKAAYEQLKKLRDEYGSIADAQRELAQELTNTITGTTPQAISDSIRQGILSGKKEFADFADDIEGFLRGAILAGMETDLFKTQIKALQDEFAKMAEDGTITEDERNTFQSMYMAVVDETKKQMELMNQAGINMNTSSSSNANSLQGAYKAASQESIDLLSGNTAGLRLAVLETNAINKGGFAAMLESSSKMVAIQLDIEKNTRKTAENTEKLHDIDKGITDLGGSMDKEYKALQAAGIIR